MKKWEAKEYLNNFNFVTNYGSGVIELLNLTPNMKGLDLGCGNGDLTLELSEKDINIIGIDQSFDMIELAKKRHPNLEFYNIDALKMPYQNEFDFVFSNAVFHWIKEQELLAKNISTSLKQGGQLVCEFGGYGCASKVHEALKKAFNKRNIEYVFPFYFPNISTHTKILEDNGLTVTHAFLFDRFTKLNEGNTVIDWIKMFVTEAFINIEENIKNEIYSEVLSTLKPTLLKEDGWYIDYVRIRIKAIKN